MEKLVSNLGTVMVAQLGELPFLTPEQRSTVRIPSVTSPFTIYLQIVIKKRQQRRKKGPRKARLITLVANQQKHFEPSIRILTERKFPSFNGGTGIREKNIETNPELHFVGQQR